MEEIKKKLETPRCPACQNKYLECPGHMQLREFAYEQGVLRATDQRIQKSKSFDR